MFTSADIDTKRIGLYHLSLILSFLLSLTEHISADDLGGSCTSGRTGQEAHHDRQVIFEFSQVPGLSDFWVSQPPLIVTRDLEKSPRLANTIQAAVFDTFVMIFLVLDDWFQLVSCRLFLVNSFSSSLSSMISSVEPTTRNPKPFGGLI